MVCDIRPPASAKEFLEWNISQNLPNAKLLGVEPIPDDWTLNLREQVRDLQRTYGGSPGTRVSLDTARAHLQSSVNGKPVEGWVMAAVTVTAISSRVGTRYSTDYKCSLVAFVALRAPQGQLQSSDALFRSVLFSARPEPEWQNRLAQGINQMTASRQRAEQQRSQIINQHQADMNKIIMGGYENRQRIQNNVAIQNDQTVRGQNTYLDPYTGKKYEAPIGGSWTNEQGQHITGTDNPNGTIPGQWRQAQPTQPTGP
jgi:hypothetical protein